MKDKVKAHSLLSLNNSCCVVLHYKCHSSIPKFLRQIDATDNNEVLYPKTDPPVKVKSQKYFIKWLVSVILHDQCLQLQQCIRLKTEHLLQGLPEVLYFTLQLNIIFP